MKKPLPLNDGLMVPDTFAAILVRTETVGPCTRLVFAVPQAVDCAGEEVTELVVVAKIIVPTDMLSEIGHLLNTGVEVRMVRTSDETPTTLN